MILRRVKVEGFRCFREPVELDGLGLGVHVLHGPNETGKSTILLAVARALFDRYGAGGQDVEKLRPWGTSLSPRIELEFEAGGTRYLLVKRFLEEKQSLLSEWKADRFERQHESDRADEFVRELLRAERSKTRLSSLEHWGFARLLWLTQDGTQPAMPGVSTTLEERLLETLGAARLDSREQALLDALAVRYGEYFPKKKKELKEKNPLAEAEARLAACVARAGDLRRQYDEAARLLGAVADDELRLEAFHASKLELERRRAQLLHDVEKERQTEAALERTKRTLQGLDESLSLLERHRETLAALALESGELREKARLAGLAVDELALAEEAALLRERTERDALASAELAAELAAALLEDGRRRDEVRSLERDRMRLAGLAERSRRIAESIDARARETSEQPAPGASELDHAERMRNSIRESRASLEAIGVELRFTAELATALSVTRADGSLEQLPLGAGETRTIAGLDGATLVLPGVGRLELLSRAGDIAAIRRTLESDRGALAGVLGRWRLETVEQLRDSVRAGEARGAELQALRRALAELLGDDFADARAVTAAIGELDERIARIRSLEDRAGRASSGGTGSEGGSLSTESREPEDRESVELSSLEELARRSVEASVASKRARERLAEAESARAAAQARLAEIRKARDDEAARAGAFEALRLARASDLGDPEALAAQRARQLVEAEMARETIRALELQLPPPDQRASARLASLDGELRAVEADAQDMRVVLSGRHGTLRALAAEGLYSRLADAEEEGSTLEAAVGAERSRAAGVQLLQSLADARKARIAAELVEPIERHVRARLAIIRGGAHHEARARLTPRLETVEFAVRGEDEASLDVLSRGTREQFMLALRLSLASLLAESGPAAEPQLVVLDDPLVNTDPPRAARALELITGEASRLQVLILTAFPERYRADGVTFHDLGKKIRGALG